ncbi:MAG: UDP-2,3-diacylglucosamine diphosphatase [Desulfomonilia bacterium]
MYAFIADVHLSPANRPDHTRFISWLRTVKPRAEEIFILGDLFDYWYSGMEHLFQDVMAELRAPGVQVIPGNRDFLLKTCPDEQITVSQAEEIQLSVYGTDTLIAHGHTLTEDDYGFKFVHAVAWPLLRILDRRLPTRLKDSCARFLVRSSASIRPPRAVIADGIARTRGVEKVICGHLHRTVMEEHLIVLPAFFDSPTWLSWDREGPRFSVFDTDTTGC